MVNIMPRRPTPIIRRPTQIEPSDFIQFVTAPVFTGCFLLVHVIGTIRARVTSISKGNRGFISSPEEREMDFAVTLLLETSYEGNN